VFSGAIISISAAHSGHHARVEPRLRMINKESFSILIVVYFAIEPPFQLVPSA
jgi:hypothetical protein